MTIRSKSRDVVFQEDIFTRLGSVGRQTEKDWHAWELEVKRPLESHTTVSTPSHTTPLDPVVVLVSPDSSRPSTPPLNVPLED